MNYEDTLQGARRAETERDIQEAKMKRQWEEKRQQDLTNAAPMLSKLRNCRKRHYECWLEAFIEDGGQPTHYNNCGFSTSFRYCRTDLEIFPLYGADRPHGIVLKKGKKLTVHGAGHNNVFYWDEDGFPQVLGPWIPVYKDMLPEEQT